MQRGKSYWAWGAALTCAAGVYFFSHHSLQRGVSVAPEQAATIDIRSQEGSPLVSGPSYMTAGISSESSELADLTGVPGGSIVQDSGKINDAPVGAEGVGKILTDGSGTDFDRGRSLARIALNASESDEVRQEALEQWLKMIPEEGVSILSLLAKDARMDDNMRIMLLKDTISRGPSVQVSIAYQMLGGSSEDVESVSKAVLVKMLGRDYGPAKSDWGAAVHAFLAANNN